MLKWRRYIFPACVRPELQNSIIASSSDHKEGCAVNTTTRLGRIVGIDASMAPELDRITARSYRRVSNRPCGQISVRPMAHDIDEYPQVWGAHCDRQEGRAAVI